MKPFKIKPNSKLPIFDQVVFAATKAILSGAMKPGDPFPSVRALASDLKIHPNTAHKVVQHLIREGWLDSVPGKGTTIAEKPGSGSEDRKQLLSQEVKQVVAEARRMGVSREELKELIDSHWAAQGQLKAVSDDH